MADTIATAPALVLLCLGPCHGEFYLPLDAGDLEVCPNDPDHPTAVYKLLGTVERTHIDCLACNDTGIYVDGGPCPDC